MVSQREEAATLALAAEASAKQEADSLRAQVCTPPRLRATRVQAREKRECTAGRVDG